MSTELYTLNIDCLNDQSYMSVGFHVKGDNLTANDTLTNSQDLVESFEDTPINFFLGVMSPMSQISCVRASRRSPVGGAEFRHRYVPGTAAGTLGTQFTADQLNPSVRILPAMGGTVVNRVFLPAAPDTAVNGNSYSAGYISAVTALMDALITNFGIGSIQWTLAVFSPKLSTYTEAATYNLSPRIGFQRRRQLPY